MEKYAIKQNKCDFLYDKYIEIFKNSASYNEADRLFSCIIANNLKKFSKEQTILLIDAINGNDQLYNRNRAYYDNNKIIEIKANILGLEFNYLEYENFKYSKELLEKVILPF